MTFFIASPVLAQNNIVINEFVVEPTNSQWVELYNKSSASVDISGWIIDDNGGIKKFTIPDSTIIDGNSIKVFESGIFYFNKSTPDNVRLFSADETPVDSKDYDASPGNDVSIGRTTDGSIEWSNFSPPTKGKSNNPDSALPTNTPAPTITPKPTSTPIPTATAKSATKTPTPMVTESVIESTQNTKAEQQDYEGGKSIGGSDFSSDNQNKFDYLDRILSEATESGLATASSSPTATPTAQLRSMISKLFLFLGGLSLIAMVASAVYVERKKLG